MAATKTTKATKATEETKAIDAIKALLLQHLDIEDKVADDVSRALLVEMARRFTGVDLNPEVAEQMVLLEQQLLQMEQQVEQLEKDLAAAKRRSALIAASRPAAATAGGLIGKTGKVMPRNAAFSSALSHAVKNGIEYALQHPIADRFEKSKAERSRANYALHVEPEDGSLHLLLSELTTLGELVKHVQDAGMTQHVSYTAFLYGTMHKDDIDAIIALHPGQQEEVTTTRRLGTVAGAGAGKRVQTGYDLFAQTVKSTVQDVLDIVVEVGNYFPNKSASKTFELYQSSEELQSLQGTMTFGELCAEASKVFTTAQQYRPGVWGMLSPESKVAMVAPFKA